MCLQRGTDWIFVIQFDLYSYTLPDLYQKDEIVLMMMIIANASPYAFSLSFSVWTFNLFQSSSSTRHSTV
jgi:hypothetical protein